jgi:hypothetical protein
MFNEECGYYLSSRLPKEEHLEGISPKSRNKLILAFTS